MTKQHKCGNILTTFNYGDFFQIMRRRSQLYEKNDECSYSGGSVKPNVIQGNRTITSTPNGYNSNANAVKAYSDLYAAQFSYLESVKITGLESKSVSLIYPVCPRFPAHIY